MHAPNDQPQSLHTPAGVFPLDEYRLYEAGREWSVLYTGAVLSQADEGHFLRELREHVPYGVTLWPAAIALAHDIASRADGLRGQRVLELGAGTGLPGIVAAALGAQVVQTDRHPAALKLCQHNGARNNIATITYRLADWTDWHDLERYNWILGADMLYDAAMHPHLRRIFRSNLAANGRIVLSDPFRAVSLQLLEALEADGWTISLSTWSVGEEGARRSIGIFDLMPPG